MDLNKGILHDVFGSGFSVGEAKYELEQFGGVAFDECAKRFWITA